MAKEICKLQRPLWSTEDKPKILVYNEDKSLFMEVNMTPELIDNVFGDEFKVFKECKLKGETLEIGATVEWQDW